MSGDALVEIGMFMSTQGCGIFGRSLWMNVAPDESTGVALFISELQGVGPDRLLSTGFIRKPRYRFDIRSTAPRSTQGDYPDPTAAREIARLAYNTCEALADMDLSDGVHQASHWLFAHPETEPYLAGRDSMNRVVLTFTVSCERQAP